MRILVVENDATLHGLLRIILAEGEGDEVDFSLTGEAALGMLTAPYDVIVVDGRMPGMSGPEFVEQAREWYRAHARRAPYMVGLSGHQAFREQFEALGLVVVPKPFRLSQFVATVRREKPC